MFILAFPAENETGDINQERILCIITVFRNSVIVYISRSPRTNREKYPDNILYVHESQAHGFYKPITNSQPATKELRQCYHNPQLSARLVTLPTQRHGPACETRPRYFSPIRSIFFRGLSTVMVGCKLRFCLIWLA